MGDWISNPGHAIKTRIINPLPLSSGIANPEERGLRVDHTGRFRAQFTRDDIPVTPRLRLWGTWNTDLEYGFGLRRTLTKYISISAHYDSDMKLGGGLTLTY